MSRTIVVGLDGLSPMLMGLDEAENIREKYQQNGGILESTYPPTTGPAWTSFQTGKNPENHKITSLIKINEIEGGYQTSEYSASDIESETIYEALQAEGEDCFVMNLPYTFPPKIEGDVITSWLTNSDDIDDFIHPDNLKHRYSTIQGYQPHPTGNNDKRFLQSLLEIEEKRTDIAREVIESEDHGFLFFLFSGTDTIQHRAFRDLLEEKHTTTGDISRDVLSEIDNFVGWLFDNCKKTDNIVLMSDHGFRMYEGLFSINSWLNRNGYLEFSDGGESFSNESNTSTVNLGKIYEFVRGNEILANIGMPVYRFLDSLGIELTSNKEIDVDNSVAFCRHDQEQSIHINVGDVEYSKIKSDLIEDLSEVSGITPVDIEKEYGSSEQMGDIVIISDTYQVIRGDVNEPVIERSIPYHHVDGVMMLHGPAFKDCPERANIEDIMPTLLHINDYPVPKDLDGEVLSNSIHSDDPISYRDPRTGNMVSAEESESDAVEDRLKDLGYL